MLIKMKNDAGHEVDVHPSMVDDYRLGGYVPMKAPQEEVRFTAPKRGRPKKKAD